MKKKVFENCILIAIILVIVQTFLDDYSRYAGFTIQFRNFLLFSGFLFDLIFSIEFVMRTRWAMRENKVRTYLLYERGWIDFLSSFPLLLLSSGPMVFLFLSGSLSQSAGSIAVLNVLKVIKAIRITRILRLIRILKIFGKIHNARSVMAQRHTQTISTLIVFTVIVILITFSLFKFSQIDTLMEDRKMHYTGIVENIENINRTMNIPLKPLTSKLLSSDKNILKLYYADFLIFSNISDHTFHEYFNFEDYIIINENEYILYVSLADINKLAAGINLQNFFIIILLVLCIMTIYTKHFVQTISDVIHIMLRGFKEKDYNLQVKIQEQYKEDEIFHLAEEYNENYLPLKSKNLQEEKTKKSTALSMDDLLNFGKK